MPTKRMVLMTLGTLLMVSGSPAAAMQYGAAMNAPKEPELERAEELLAEAEALFSEPKRWRKAMQLLEKSAELRPADDPGAYRCLMYAGRLGAAVGDYAGARMALTKAAEHALARGEITDAATAYIDAAHAAGLEGQPKLAKEMLERASLLSRSPLLSAAARSALEYRLGA